MTLNLRKEFKNLLKEDGWNIYLQRRSGPGKNEFSNILEIHTVRDNFSSLVAAAHLKEEQEEGITVVPHNVFYFLWDVAPGEGDRIYEEFPNQADNATLWLIDYTKPFRGFGGEIIYWGCGVTREHENNSVRYQELYVPPTPEEPEPDIPWDGGSAANPGIDGFVDGGDASG